MTDKKHKKDFDFAQRICAALRKGKTEAIEIVYNRFHPFFLVFAQNRLRTLSTFYEHDALSVADKYWIELLNGKYICNYLGSGSLKNYLMRRLKDRITDKIRKIIKAKETPFSQGLVSPGDDRTEDDQIDAAIYKNVLQVETPYDQLVSEQTRQILYESLFQLVEEHPVDADYIKMHLDGMTYKQMAQIELASVNPDEETVRKKANAIKVRFMRKKRGSLARFTKILVRNMDKYGIDEREVCRYF